MTDAITWKFVNQEQLTQLMQCHSTDDCKRELARIFYIDTDDKQKALLLDSQLYNYSFTRQQHFQPDQTSVLLGILHCLMEADFTRESTTTLDTSYRMFQTLLLAHSIDRSPKSVQLFTPAEVKAIVDFVAHTYYRHFNLYKCIFTPFFHTYLVQKQVEGVQMPSRPRSLEEAFLHPQEEPQVDTVMSEHGAEQNAR